MFYAVTLAEARRKDDAIREGSNALEISPDDPMMLYNCACLHARLGETHRARAVAAGDCQRPLELRLDEERSGHVLAARQS